MVEAVVMGEEVGMVEVVALAKINKDIIMSGT